MVDAAPCASSATNITACDLIHQITVQPAVKYCTDSDPDVRTQLSEDEWGCTVARTEGYSGSDMRNLMQEACSFAVREATKDALRSAITLAVGHRTSGQSTFRTFRWVLLQFCFFC